MSKQYNIKWRIQDEEELQRVARNFNQKLAREIKKNPKNRTYLPQFFNESTETFESKIRVEKLKELTQTRQDFNRYVNMLKRFSRPGATDIIDAPGNLYESKITKWQRDEMIRLASIVNKKRKERLDLLNLVEMRDAEGKLGYTVGEMFGMGLASKNRLSPTKAFTPSQSMTDLRYKLNVLLKESRNNYFKDRDQILKDNFIRTLLQNYDKNDIKDVIEAIQKMDNNAFVLKFEAKGDAFEFAYPPDGDQYESYLSELKAYWIREDSILDFSPTLTSAIVDRLEEL